MKGPMISSLSGSSETDRNEQIQKAVADTIKESNDKVVEIKPANESKGSSMVLRMILVVGAFAAGYWLRKSQKPTKKLQSAASEAADRTKQVTKQAADTIKEDGETVTERVEKESEKAGEKVEQTGETVAERVEEGSEKASEQVEQAGEKAAQEAEKAGEMAAKKANESGSS